MIFASGTYSVEQAHDEFGIQTSVSTAADNSFFGSRLRTFILGNKQNGQSLVCTAKDFDTLEYAKILKSVFSVTPGVVLVFCTSYERLRSLKEELLNLHVPVYEEPTERQDIAGLMTDLQSDRSILLAVFRGKLSDGFNFCEGLVRVICCVGIPLATLDEPRVLFQREAGKYEFEAMIAVNQAIGRLDRGRPNDFGVILLLDFRYKKAPFFNLLNRNLNPAVTISVADTVNELKGYFETRMTLP
jgi:Rad3-related DNA helicase